MANYLDETGLTTLWKRIKTKFPMLDSDNTLNDSGSVTTQGKLNANYIPNIAASKITGVIDASHLPSYVDDILEFGGVVSGETKVTVGTDVSSTTASTDPSTVKYYEGATTGSGTSITNGFYVENGSTIYPLPSSGTQNGVVPNALSPEKGKIYVSVGSLDKTVYRYGGSSAGLVEIYNPSQLSELEQLVYRLHFTETFSGSATLELGKEGKVTLSWKLQLDGSSVDNSAITDFKITKVDKTGSSDTSTVLGASYSDGSYTDTVTPTKVGENFQYKLSFVYNGKTYNDKSVSVTAYRRTYWGNSTAIDGGTYTNLAINTGAVKSSVNGTYAVTTSGNNAHVYIICPASVVGGISAVKNISVTAGGQPIPFKVLGYVTSATSGLNEDYVLYRTINEQPSRTYVVSLTGATTAASAL